MNSNIHRFGDCVAVSVGNGDTTYLTPAQAIELTKAIQECVRDIKHYKFSSGQFNSVSIDIDSESNRHRYVQRRTAKIVMDGKLIYIPA